MNKVTGDTGVIQRKLQRAYREKEMLLAEVQNLRMSLKSFKSSQKGGFAVLDQDGDHSEGWNHLLEANMRSGTLACLWVIKTHRLKIFAQAFNKWKLKVHLSTLASGTQSKQSNFALVNTFDQMRFRDMDTRSDKSSYVGSSPSGHYARTNSSFGENGMRRDRLLRQAQNLLSSSSDMERKKRDNSTRSASSVGTTSNKNVANLTALYLSSAGYKARSDTKSLPSGSGRNTPSFTPISAIATRNTKQQHGPDNGSSNTTGKLVKKQPNFSLPTYSSMKMFPPNSMTSPNSTASGKNRSRREYNDYLRKKVEQSRSQSASPDARARSASPHQSSWTKGQNNNNSSSTDKSPLYQEFLSYKDVIEKMNDAAFTENKDYQSENVVEKNNAASQTNGKAKNNGHHHGSSEVKDDVSEISNDEEEFRNASEWPGVDRLTSENLNILNRVSNKVKVRGYPTQSEGSRPSQSMRFANDSKKGMTKAQLRLLYGDLEPVAYGKTAWSKSLRSRSTADDRHSKWKK